ncbi:MAG: TolC family protein [Endomicrobiaceae bacterium]
MKKVIFLCFILMIIASLSAENLITLEEAIEIAIENNLSLKSSYNNMQSSKWASTNAKTQLLPKLNFNETAILYDKERVIMPEINLGSIVIPETKQDKKNFISTLQLEQVLFAGGKLYNSSKISALQYQISINNYEKKLKDLTAKVQEYYYQILKTQSSIEILQNQKQLCEDIKNNAETLFNNGIGLETDVMQWELQVIQVENQLIQLEASYKLLLDSWSILLGFESKYNNTLPKTIELDEIFAEVETYNSFTNSEKEQKLNEYLSKVKTTNYDIKNLENSKQSLNYLNRISKADFMPSLFLNMNYEIENDNKLNLDGDNNWQIMANLSIPLFHSGSNYSNYQNQKYEIKSQMNLIEENVQSLMIIAKQAWYDYDNAINSLKQANKSNIIAKRALELTHKLYLQGMTTNLSLTEAQNTNQTSELQFINSIYDYIIYKNNLNKFTGDVK